MSRWAMIEPRMSRVKIGMLTTPIAIITWSRPPWPNSATIPIAIRKPGIASMMSITRMIRPSVRRK